MGQGTLSVSSVRKYQRAATRPRPGIVKNSWLNFNELLNVLTVQRLQTCSKIYLNFLCLDIFISHHCIIYVFKILKEPHIERWNEYFEKSYVLICLKLKYQSSHWEDANGMKIVSNEPHQIYTGELVCETNAHQFFKNSFCYMVFFVLFLLFAL